MEEIRCYKRNSVILVHVHVCTWSIGEKYEEVFLHTAINSPTQTIQNGRGKWNRIEILLLNGNQVNAIN